MDNFDRIYTSLLKFRVSIAQEVCEKYSSEGAHSLRANPPIPQVHVQNVLQEMLSELEGMNSPNSDWRFFKRKGGLRAI